MGYVSRTSQLYFANEEIREEAGTPGILEFIRASLAYQLREEIGQEWIANSKKELIKILKEFLENESKITIYGNPNYNSMALFLSISKTNLPMKLLINSPKILES